MEIFKTVKELSDYRIKHPSVSSDLGFVPTMGALHEGHLSLVLKAKEANKHVAVSIFVNPIQFNNKSDLEHYPRTVEQDLKLLGRILGENDFVFIPDEKEMYPAGVTKTFDFGKLESVMEGAHRPGHFNGVGVVVDLLFQHVQPTHAYFGEKDFQQIAIIKEMVRQEKHRVEIVPCQIIREENGLAMSSRNMRLTPDNRDKASAIYQLLCEVKDQIQPEQDLTPLQEHVINKLNELDEFRTEYVVFAEEEGLKPVTTATKLPFRCFIAVFAGEIRLIDNLSMS